jgi:hypothetical protein
VRGQAHKLNALKPRPLEAAGRLGAGGRTQLQARLTVSPRAGRSLLTRPVAETKPEPT